MTVLIKKIAYFACTGDQGTIIEIQLFIDSVYSIAIIRAFFFIRRPLFFSIVTRLLCSSIYDYCNVRLSRAAVLLAEHVNVTTCVLKRHKNNFDKRENGLLYRPVGRAVTLSNRFGRSEVLISVW